jgi:hypothetical protein
MSYSISTLLIRNLRDVFGENDPARRRAAIDGPAFPTMKTCRYRPDILRSLRSSR